MFHRYLYTVQHTSFYFTIEKTTSLIISMQKRFDHLSSNYSIQTSNDSVTSVVHFIDTFLLRHMDRDISAWLGGMRDFQFSSLSLDRS